MNIFGNRVFMIGDYVQYKGRGGSKRSRENVWEILEIINEEQLRSYYRGPVAKLRLVKGMLNDSNNHDCGPGYIKKYYLKDLKHIEEAVG